MCLCMCVCVCVCVCLSVSVCESERIAIVPVRCLYFRAKRSVLTFVETHPHKSEGHQSRHHHPHLSTTPPQPIFPVHTSLNPPSPSQQNKNNDSN